ncbi:hypothetical protein ACIBF1_05580 [Spirillospora sp. NPDC050679]
MVDEQMTDDLRAVLKNAAGHAPPPGRDLLERVESRYRGRRRRRMAGAATMAVVVGATGVLGASLLLGGDGYGKPRPASKPTAGPLKPTTPGPVVQLEKTAPQAFRTLPKRLPNGQDFHPDQMLEDGTVLGTTWSSFELTDRIWVYDLAKNKARAVTDVTMPRGQKWFANDLTTADGQVVWTMTYHGDKSSFEEPGFEKLELWTAPLAGGAARKVTSITAAQKPLDQGTSTSDELALDGGEAVWATTAGVLTVPLTGGKPRLLPGTKGYQILSWPWIGTPGRGTKGPKVGEVMFKELRNVRTGERRTATTARFNGAWTCGLVWCFGGMASGVTYHGTQGQRIQRRDGKEGRVLPESDVKLMFSGQTFLDRYILYRPRPAQTGRTPVRPRPGQKGRTPTQLNRSKPSNHMLYDLQTGRLLDTGVRQPSSGSMPGLLASPNSRIMMLTGEDGATILLDLSKVG